MSESGCTFIFTHPKCRAVHHGTGVVSRRRCRFTRECHPTRLLTYPCSWRNSGVAGPFSEDSHDARVAGLAIPRISRGLFTGVVERCARGRNSRFVTVQLSGHASSFQARGMPMPTSQALEPLHDKQIQGNCHVCSGQKSRRTRNIYFSGLVLVLTSPPTCDMKHEF